MQLNSTGYSGAAKQNPPIPKGKLHPAYTPLLAKGKSMKNASLVAVFVVMSLVTGGVFAQKAPPVKETLEKAAKGDLKALFNAGLMHENGDGVKKDYAKAAEYYRQASERYMPEAQAAMGYLSMDGKGIPKDIRRACMYFGLAAEKGITELEGPISKTCGTLSAADKEWVEMQKRARRGTMI
jgi:TPR repeat protein